jgi:hypothetical protein
MTTPPGPIQPVPAPAEVRFDWTDPLLLDESLCEDEWMARDSAHADCQEKLFSRVLEANRHEHFEREITNEMASDHLARLHWNDAAIVFPGRREDRGAFRAACSSTCLNSVHIPSGGIPSLNQMAPTRSMPHC